MALSLDECPHEDGGERWFAPDDVDVGQAGERRQAEFAAGEDGGGDGGG